MIRKIPSATSRDLFRTLLSDWMNPKHEPALPANKIDRSYFENEFKGFYSEKPSRLMVGVLILKHLYRLGDDAAFPLQYEIDDVRVYENGVNFKQSNSNSYETDYHKKRRSKEESIQRRVVRRTFYCRQVNGNKDELRQG
jgi:hypothetical protein